MENILDGTNMPDLSNLFNKYGSDKDVNGYAIEYFSRFRWLQDKEFVLIEIGIGTMIPGVQSSMQGFALPGYAPGGSLRAWRDFFPKARVIGLDIQPDTQFSDDRIETYICDSSNKAAVDELMAKLNVRPCLIIEDSLHDAAHQLQTLANFWQYLAPEGTYVIEDITQGSILTKAPSLISVACDHNCFSFSGLKSNLCFITKHKLNTKRLNY